MLIIISLMAINLKIHCPTLHENAGFFLKVSTAMSCLNSTLLNLRDLFLTILLQSKLTTL